MPDYQIMRWDESNFDYNKYKASKYAYQVKKYALVSDVCRYNVLAEYGGASYAINERLDNDRLQLSLVKSKYEEAKVDATEFIPHKFVVTSAFKAERKSYPVRWIIVVVTLLSTFLLLLFCVVIYDRSRGFFRYKAEEGAANQTPKGKKGATA